MLKSLTVIVEFLFLPLILSIASLFQRLSAHTLMIICLHILFQPSYAYTLHDIFFDPVAFNLSLNLKYVSEA